MLQRGCVAGHDGVPGAEPPGGVSELAEDYSSHVTRFASDLLPAT